MEWAQEIAIVARGPSHTRARPMDACDIEVQRALWVFNSISQHTGNHISREQLDVFVRNSQTPERFDAVSRRLQKARSRAAVRKTEWTQKVRRSIVPEFVDA